MSNRPTVRSAFEGLRPSIVREPTRAVIKPQDESSLLQTAPFEPPEREHIDSDTLRSLEASAQPLQAPGFQGATLLKKKKREVLIPVTFRIPLSLKEKLNEVARKHEINQTDLINEGIELNLQRYR